MTTAANCSCHLQYLLNRLLDKLVDLIFSSDIKLIKTPHNPNNACFYFTVEVKAIRREHFDATLEEGAAFLLGIHGQLSAEADPLLNVNVPVSMPTVLPLQAVFDLAVLSNDTLGGC